ncbi:MAG: hypothetical protein OXT71_10520 [Acidobacteriota bacterium]|nr:hypothetical protein [Acidobacteriota bacterium]
MKSQYGDPRTLTFSQAYGYEEIPQRLKLEELSGVARTKMWDVLFSSLDYEKTWGPGLVELVWYDILRDKHLDVDNQALDLWDFEGAKDDLRQAVMTHPFNKVFDLVQFILRHAQCPADLVDEMKEAFEKGMVAYIIDDNGPPTIFPASTPEEGRSLTKALHTLQQGGLSAAEDFLRDASKDINRGDWAGSIKNSVDAAESVARTLVPRAQTFGAALNEIKKNPAFWHPQLVRAMENIWTYTNQAGVRHGSPEPTGEYVGLEEALFMLGTCAAVASYLWRKHPAGEKS